MTRYTALHHGAYPSSSHKHTHTCITLAPGERHVQLHHHYGWRARHDGHIYTKWTTDHALRCLASVSASFPHCLSPTLSLSITCGLSLVYLPQSVPLFVDSSIRNKTTQHLLISHNRISSTMYRSSCSSGPISRTTKPASSQSFRKWSPGW